MIPQVGQARFCPQYDVHTVPVEQGSTEKWLLFWEVTPQASFTTMEYQEVRKGGDCVPGTCPKKYIFLQDLVRVESLLQTQQREKWRRKGREGLVKVWKWFHLLILWVEDHKCCADTLLHPQNRRRISPLQHWGKALGLIDTITLPWWGSYKWNSVFVWTQRGGMLSPDMQLIELG